MQKQVTLEDIRDEQRKYKSMMVSQKSLSEMLRDIRVESESPERGKESDLSKSTYEIPSASILQNFIKRVIYHT